MYEMLRAADMVAFPVTVTLPGLFILFLTCVGSRLIALGKTQQISSVIQHVHLSLGAVDSTLFVFPLTSLPCWVCFPACSFPQTLSSFTESIQ